MASDPQYEITVYLYPASGAGVQVVNTPQSPIPVPIPFNEYKDVRNLDCTWSQIRFTKPRGEIIESNLPYIVVRTPKPASEA